MVFFGCLLAIALILIIRYKVNTRKYHSFLFTILQVILASEFQENKVIVETEENFKFQIRGHGIFLNYI